MYFKLVLLGTLIPTTIDYRPSSSFVSRLGLKYRYIHWSLGLRRHSRLFHVVPLMWIPLHDGAIFCPAAAVQRLQRLQPLHENVTFVSYFFSQNPFNFSTTFHIYIFKTENIKQSPLFKYFFSVIQRCTSTYDLCEWWVKLGQQIPRRVAATAVTLMSPGTKGTSSSDLIHSERGNNDVYFYCNNAFW